MATLVPLQLSLAVGKSKFQLDPHSTDLLLAQVSIGGTVSAKVTDWLHILVFPHASVASQVRVMTCGQTPFVTVLRTVMLTLVPLQLSVAVGGSKCQP